MKRLRYAILLLLLLIPSCRRRVISFRYDINKAAEMTLDEARDHLDLALRGSEVVVCSSPRVKLGRRHILRWEVNEQQARAIAVRGAHPTLLYDQISYCNVTAQGGWYLLKIYRRGFGHREWFQLWMRSLTQAQNGAIALEAFKLGGGAPIAKGETRLGGIAGGDGIYLLEQDQNFNVLDQAVFDPETGAVSLVGHRDSSYRGPRIHWLQHLSVLLENPEPEFSLEWTSASSRSVDDFLRRLDDERVMAAKVAQWAKPLDARGKVNRNALWFLKALGVQPTKNGLRGGWLGVKLAHTGKGLESRCRITQVLRNSPAEKAGLRVGDTISHLDDSNAWHPREAYRLICQAGEGATINLMYTPRGGAPKQIQVRLGWAKTDPWSFMDRYEIVGSVILASGNKKMGWTVRSLGEMMRLKGTTGAELGPMVNFFYSVGAGEDFNRIMYTNKPTDQRLRAFYPKLFRAMETTFEVGAGGLTDIYNRNIHRGPAAAFDAAFLAMNNHMPRLLEAAMKTVMRKSREIMIPPDVIASTLGTRPEVEPKFFKIDSRSALARVMLRADVLGKKLVNMPDLERDIRAYRTEFSFYRENPREHPISKDSTEHRMWISVDQVDLARSESGTTMEFRDVKMRFNIRGKRGERQDAYERHLTSLYGDFARRFFVLHELREAAKLAVVAKWIRAHKPDFRLPKTGRAEWKAPSRIPGQIYMYWAPQARSGVANVSVMAMGGVSLVPPVGPSGPVDVVEFNRHVPSNPNVVDLSDASFGTPKNLKTETITRSLGWPDPPPSPVLNKGRVVKMDRGRQALVLLGDAEYDESDHELTACLREANRRALSLHHTEKLINHINGKAALRNEELEQIGRELEQARRDFLRSSIDLITGGLQDVLGDVDDAAKLPSDVKSTAEDLFRKAELIRNMRSDSMEDRQKAIDELTDMAGDLVQKLDSGPLTPLVKTLGFAGKAKDAWDYGKSLATLVRSHHRIGERGDQADQDLKNLSDKLLPLYKNQRLRLEEILKKPGVKKALGR